MNLKSKDKNMFIREVVKMTKDNKVEAVENGFNGIVGKAYLDIDRSFNVSDYVKAANKPSKIKKN
jgi:hypothetical protein